MSSRSPIIVALVVLVALSTPAVALAKRPATPSEATAVAHALGRVYWGGYLPARCALVYISTADPSWASVGFRAGRGCRQYADGIAIMHWGLPRRPSGTGGSPIPAPGSDRHSWRIVTEGSAFQCPVVSDNGQPPIPNSVVMDLLGLDCAASENSPAVASYDGASLDRGLESRPSQIDYTSDWSGVFERLRWSTWNGREGHADGTAWICPLVCHPKRATRMPVAITVYRPRRIATAISGILGRAVRWDYVFTRLKATPRGRSDWKPWTFSLIFSNGKFIWK